MKIPAANLASVKGTPYENVAFHFVNVTPALAKEWLEQRNKKNRKLKELTISGYARDMKNGEWLTTHQGFAFNDEDHLTDGQNRLHGIVASGKTVLMVVSTGWPKKLPGQKGLTMDAVDMGCARTLADQLELQHDIKNGKFVARTAGALAKLVCGGFRASRKQSPGSVLGVAGIYKDEFNWLGENVTVTPGLRNVSVNGVIILGLFAWPEPTKKFYEQLKTGLNLTANSPVYHLRNWLTTVRVGNSEDEIYKVRMATSYHLKLFVENKTTGSLVSQSDAGLLELRKLNAERVKKIYALFDLPEPDEKTTKARRRETRLPTQTGSLPGATLPGNWRGRGVPAKPKLVIVETGNSAITPFSPEGIALGTTLTGIFTPTDLRARLDGGDRQVSTFIAFWKDRGWIEPSGLGYVKTAFFGK